LGFLPQHPKFTFCQQNEMGLEITNYRNQVVVAILPKVSAFTSLCCSFWIVLEVLFDEDSKRGVRKRENVYNRLLMGMSVYDIFYSVWNFASTWPVPRGTPDVFQPIGTQRTCIAQGYFLQIAGLGVPLYNAMLSVYYLLVIRYNISERTLRTRVEPAMHISVFVLSFGTAMVCLCLDLYNFATLWCWIAEYPLGCEGDSCIHGQHAWVFRYAFYFAPIWTMIAFACVSMISVYNSVKKKDAQSLRYRRPELRFSSKKGSGPVSDGDSSSHGELATSEVIDSAGISNELRGTSSLGFSPSSVNLAMPLPTRKTGRLATLFMKDKLSKKVNQMNEVNSQSIVPDQSCDCGIAAANSAAQTPYMPSQALNPLSSSPSDSTFSLLHPPSDSSATLVGHSRKKFLVLKKVRQWHQERRKKQLELQKSHDVFVQACCYLGIFLLTYFFSTINRAWQFVTGDTNFIITLIHSFVDPLQGICVSA